MITLYHTPLSLNSRRVWVTLLEKGLTFDTVEVDLAGDQYKPDFLALNPFHHIPVLRDGDLTVIESFAILDYLEARYPDNPLLPTDPITLARVRMAQMVTVNELLPTLTPLMRDAMGFGGTTPEDLETARKKADVSLKFVTDQLGTGPFFGGEQLTLAEMVLGTVTPWFGQLGVSLASFPQLQAWTDRLCQREAWQQTQPTSEAIEAFKERMKALMDKRQTG